MNNVSVNLYNYYNKLVNLHHKWTNMGLWGQRIWAPRPVSNNKPKGPAEEENVRGWLRKTHSY